MGRTIVINFIYPPIPKREFDFCATFDDDEPNDAGGMLAGYGPTPLQAFCELLSMVDA